MTEDKEIEALRSLFKSNQKIHLDVMEETAQHKMWEIHITIEHFNNWLEMIQGQEQYTEEEIINSISAMLLFQLGEELRRAIHSLLSGGYMDVLRALRFIFESVIRAHFLDEWLDSEVVLREMTKQGASIGLKFEVISLLDEIRDKNRERTFLNRDSQNVSGEVVDELFESLPENEQNEELKTLYTEFISRYKRLYMSFGGKKGLISQLPEDIFSESDKNDLNNLYGSLSKYSHLSSYVLDFILDDPSQIFTPGFNEKLFDKCIQLLTSVMDVFIVIIYLHFPRLEVTEWLSKSVQSLQMPLSKKMIERTENGRLANVY
ncbi:MAG: hypothetical protein HXS54_13945 [Theionarchaea archaeon]|nr:hypothetical protein [Theionarchaea archaeon]